MALKSRSTYAILGLLNLSPSTGYDIKKYCDTVLDGFWHENYGNLYPTLKKMLDEGTIKIVCGASGEKKIVYGITEKGKSELNVWLNEDTQPQPVRSEFMLKLLFSSSLPKERVLAMLEKRKSEQANKLSLYKSMQRSLAQGLPAVTQERAIVLNAVLHSGILACEAALQWCDETIEAFGKNMP